MPTNEQVGAADAFAGERVADQEFLSFHRAAALLEELGEHGLLSQHPRTSARPGAQLAQLREVRKGPLLVERVADGLGSGDRQQGRRCRCRRAGRSRRIRPAGGGLLTLAATAQQGGRTAEGNPRKSKRQT